MKRCLVVITGDCVSKITLYHAGPCWSSDETMLGTNHQVSNAQAFAKTITAPCITFACLA